jgi:hypothetical protein
MQIIEFNGLGQPRLNHITTGTIALLIQQERIGIVRSELLTPEEYGPALHHAVNNSELQLEVHQTFANVYPSGLPSESHWLLECPVAIAGKAKFQ